MEEVKENMQDLLVKSLEPKKDAEVIFVIINAGFSDLVMDAAKRKGARGGTILHARGTGNKEMEKFFGISVSEEKEIVMILVAKSKRDEVMSEIYKDAGLDTNGQGIAFAMPVEDVVGAKL